ncbi:MAG: H-NS histone family protein [Alphaproteobacteria bacterium]|nr:H-NS histone family protein [Alphaproteobacteria bacterium]
MGNLIDIQSQIEKLQKQANDIKAKEFTATVHEIQAKMQAFGITLKDLQSTKGAKGGRGKAKTSLAKAPKAAKTRKASAPVAAKYRGPNGETWSGRGLMPKWLSALVAQGQSKESFSVVTSHA